MSTPEQLKTSEALLQARGISRRFGRRILWQNLEFSLSPGEVVLLAGRNGAGKTSLLRCLAGLARPLRGQVLVSGLDLYQTITRRASIGFLPDQSLLYGDLTARENLHFAAALQGVRDPAVIVEALREADLTARADDRVALFSRGMVQRLALARALLHDPAIILLDEPFTGLDPVAAESLRARIRHERDVGHAVICVSHDATEIWDIATRVMLMGPNGIRFDLPRPGTSERFRELYLESAA